jgi:hypothetical protein
LGGGGSGMCIKWCEKCSLPRERQNPYFDQNWNIDLYDRLLIIPENNKKCLIKEIISKLDFNSNQSRNDIQLLFIGCGTGRLELPLLESLLKEIEHIRVHIVDVNEKFIKTMLPKLQNLNQVTINIHLTDIDTFLENHANLRFHIITAFFILYLLPQWHLTCRKILSNLVKNGYLLLVQEIGDFALQNLSKEENDLRKSFLALRDFIGQNYKFLYNLHSSATLGVLEDILKRLKIVELIELYTVEKHWQNNEVSFEEYLSAMTGKQLALAIGAECPVKFRKVIWEKFGNDWCNNLGKKKCPRIEGHRVWIVQVREPDKVADLFLQSYYILLSQIESRFFLLLEPISIS